MVDEEMFRNAVYACFWKKLEAISGPHVRNVAAALRLDGNSAHATVAKLELHGAAAELLHLLECAEVVREHDPNEAWDMVATAWTL